MESLVTKPVRKKKKTIGGYQAPSVIPGIKHLIEGAPPPKEYTVTPGGRTITSKGGDIQQYKINRYTDAQGRDTSPKELSAQSALENKAFAAKQEARKRIQPIADPAAGEAERRKKAARRRMRGRLGTLLSNRESLG